MPSHESTSRKASEASSADSGGELGKPICEYHQVDIQTAQSGPPSQTISIEDLTPRLTALLSDSGMRNGAVDQPPHDDRRRH